MTLFHALAVAFAEGALKDLAGIPFSKFLVECYASKSDALNCSRDADVVGTVSLKSVCILVDLTGRAVFRFVPFFLFNGTASVPKTYRFPCRSAGQKKSFFRAEIVQILAVYWAFPDFFAAGKRLAVPVRKDKRHGMVSRNGKRQDVYPPSPSSRYNI